ncbi:Splicing factor SF3a60-like protein [Phytophthora ramorum]|uniref:Splicing factor SF3a60-like protein n=1 Tax=Phytophthora ramorum TaxID=164328 RepID=UPI0030951A5C|nr:Splicing factor SF3a60-like protein [Phytophthora ramorum]
MSSTVLEQLRAEQEEVEALERAVVATLGEKPRNHRSRVLHGHKVSNLLDEVTHHSKHVKELYNDEDGIFADETESMRGRAVFTSFYEQLKSIRSFHRKYPNSVVSHEPNLEEALHPNVQFSGEERFGKYVDLNEFYTRFLNIPELKWQARKTQEALSSSAKTKGKKQPTGSSIDYLAYLASFSDFSAIPAAQKTHSVPYQQYLKDLKEYLLDFYRRTQPLVDLDDVIDETSAKFEKQWVLHQIAGWDSNQDADNADDSSTPAHFCELCSKQFNSEGVFNGHLTGKKHKKFAAAAATKASNGSDSNDAASKAPTSGKDTKKELEARQKGIAFDEVLIRRMYELLTEVVQGTISYLELKQTRTHEELQAEIEEEEEGAFSDVDVENENEEGEDEEEQLYNPLNLPLGWDGKPIPYWLYKLHGLGVEFKCEICGNHSYWGRRAFDRHFQEWRHAFGMRCLKIPNTKHFHDITLMRDAIQLYEKLKDQIDTEVWNASNEEEFEDSEGNVLNKKTYEDLARQGLL